MLKSEMRKLLSLPRLLILIIAFVIFYMLFFRPNLDIAKQDTSLSIQYEISEDLIEKYGTELDFSEYEDLCANIPQRPESEIDRWIRKHEEYTELGITTFEDLEKALESLPTETAAILSGNLNIAFSQDEQADIRHELLKIQYLESIAEEYSTRQTINGSIGSGQLSSRTLTEMELQSLMPDYPVTYFLRLVSDYFLFMVFSLIMLIVPYSVKDNMNNMKPLLYTTKRGRHLYKLKRNAVLLGCLIIITAEIAVLFQFTWRNNFWFCKDCYITGFYSSFISAFPVTFGNYMMICAGTLLILCILLAGIIFVLAEISGNYVAALAWQLPVIICTFIFSIKFAVHFFDISQGFSVPLLLLFTSAASAGTLYFYRYRELFRTGLF